MKLRLLRLLGEAGAADRLLWTSRAGVLELLALDRRALDRLLCRQPAVANIVSGLDHALAVFAAILERWNVIRMPARLVYFPMADVARVVLAL